jgi:hypothetical protein
MFAHRNRTLVAGIVAVFLVLLAGIVVSTTLYVQTEQARAAEEEHRRVAEIVRQHVRLDRYADNGHPGEAEVVNYADKRVLHDTITDLKARMTYIQERYGTTRHHRDRIAVLWQTTLELEARLFARLPFGPEALVEKMSLGTRDENPLNRVS